MASNAMTCPRERRSGGIETKPGAAPGKHLHGRSPGARGAAPSTPARPASRPGPRSGRPRARLFRLLPVLALLLGTLGLFPAQQAQAQADTVLVSNFGQAIAPGPDANSIKGTALEEDSFATGFTTGSAAGYILSSIDARMKLIPTQSRYDLAGIKAELWSSNNGAPNAKIVSLTATRQTAGPVTFTVGTNVVTFTAPAGTRLARNTTYHLVLYRTTSPDDEALVTASTSEDAGAATGWSIADAHNFILETTPPSGSWRTRPASSRFTGFLRVKGEAVQPAFPPGAVGSLTATGGDGKADLAWTAPSEVIGGYEIHVTTATRTAVANDAAALASGTRDDGWQASDYTDAALKPRHTVGSLTNGAVHRVRVRAVNGAGNGPWSHATVTPAATTTPTAQWAQSSVTVQETDADQRVILDIVLSEALTDTVVFSLGRTGGTATTSGSGVDWELVPTECAVGRSGATSHSCPIIIKGDNDAESDETIELTLTGVTSGTAALGTRKVLTVNIQDDDTAPAAPTSLNVTPGVGRLDLAWTAPAGAVTGYDVHYTSATVTNVANGAAVQTGGAAAGWVAVSRGTEADPPTVSQVITGLTGNTAYRVRVRAKNGEGDSAWAFGTGTTPQGKVWSFAPSGYDAVEDEAGATDITIQLAGGVAPTGGLTFTLTPLFGGDVPSTTHSRRCDTNSGRAVRADLGTTVPTTLTVQAGETEGSARFSIVVDAVDDHNECFAIRAATTTAGWTVRSGTEQYDVAHILIEERVPDEPTGLTVAPGNAKLDLSWTASQTGVVAGYDVHYTSNTSVAAGATVQAGAASVGWKAVSRSGTAASQSITGLTNDTPYRVRVRAKNSGGPSIWVHGSGTPTATPAPSAQLTGLTLTAGGNNVPISPTFAGGTTSYTALVPHGTTSVTVAASWVVPTISGTSMTVRAASVRGDGQGPIDSSAVISGSGSPGSRSVRLVTSGNTRVVVTTSYHDGTTTANLEYTITVSRVPVAPTALTVTADTAKLDLSWTAPSSGTVTGYDVHYTSAPTTGNGAVANDAAVQTGLASAGWKAVSRSGVTTSQSITGLTNDTPYRVRVRATNANGGGAWVFGTGTPKAKTWNFSSSGYTAAPGASPAIRIQLSVPAPDGGLSFTLAQKLGTNVPTGLCDDGETKATAEDIGANPPTTLTVQAGETVGRVNYPYADNGDDRVGGTDECFAVSASTSATGWTLTTGSSASVEMLIGTSIGLVAFGQSGGPDSSVPRYAATVSEGAGTVSVPVTVDLLPSSSTTFAVEVVTGQGGGTATEYVDAQNPGDFRIATKSVTFTTSDTSRTKNLSVAINDDSDMESGETIVLRLADASANSYTRLTNGQYATLTIQDNEGPPLETVVSRTMTVGDGGSWKGFRASSNTGALDNANFTYGGVTYTILGLRLTNSGGFLVLHLNKGVDRKWGLVLVVGGTRFPLADAALFTGNYEGVMASWGYGNLPGSPTPPSWGVGQTVSVSLGEPAPAAVKLSVRPNPVNEGSSASVEACLTALPQQGRTVRIPVVLSHGGASEAALAKPSEDGDWGVSLTGDTDGRLPIRTTYSIAISGWLQRACGTVNIPTHPDSDPDDETFTVALDTANLPPGVQAGSPASVEVRIKDLSNLPEVTLRAVHDTVAEGSPVELQAVLTKPLATDVAIPLRVRFVTSETADHGFIRSITIPAGSTTGSGTIRTHEDADTDDERFQVAVIQPDLPSGVAPGSPSTVGITIADGANARLRALDLSGN